jgi:hypothetical protein
MSAEEDTAAGRYPDAGSATPPRYQEGPYWQDGWYWPGQAAEGSAQTSGWNGPAAAPAAEPAAAEAPPPAGAPPASNGSGAANWSAPAAWPAATNGSGAANWPAPAEAPVATNGTAPTNWPPPGDTSVETNGSAATNGSGAANGSQPSAVPPAQSFADGQVIDIRELPVASVKPGPRVIQTDADAAEAAAEWMRWMGFADADRASTGPDAGIDVISTGAVAQVTLHDKPALEELRRAATGRLALLFSLETYPDDVRSWGDTAGVALFRFDGHGEPEPTNNRAAELMPARQFGAGRLATVTTWCEPYPAVGPGLLVYPTMVSDAQAVSVMRKKRQGLLYNRETLAWVRQTWIPLYCIRTEFTTMSGLRGELRFASCQQMFDSIGGHPFNFKPPKNMAPLQMAGPTVVPIDPRLAATEIMNETVARWNDYCGRAKKADLKRDSAALTARGVPAGVAHTINLELESEVLYPVFVGLLTHSTGHRLAVVDGVRSGLHPPLTAGMTANFRYLMDQLERNRYVELGTPGGYFVS